MFRRNKLSKYEKIELRKQKEKLSFEGKGIYLYENNTGADLYLPKPLAGGKNTPIGVPNPKIPGSGRFQGDDYYMGMVKNRELRLIDVIMSPEQQQAAEAKDNVVEEQITEESIMKEEKLILDQPDTVTEEGKIEHVNKGPIKIGQKKKVNEGSQNEQSDVLLNEQPMDGIEIFED